MAKAKQEAPRRPDIGGQAVLEGVMMRSPEYTAVAVRRKDGSIVLKRDPYVSPAKKHKWMGWPFVRGAVSMVMMLSSGMKTLEDSAKMGGEEEEEPSKFEKWLAKKLGKGVDKVVMGVAIVLALALSIGLFVLLPNAIIKLFPDPAATGAAQELAEAAESTAAVTGAAAGSGGLLLLKNLVTGLVRTALLIGYMILVRRVPDMMRTFRYHGAEHKTVYCHEAEQELTPGNAKVFSRLHPRCGTSFLLLTFILSIVFYSIVDVLVLLIFNYDLGTHYFVRILSRLLLLPCLAGISYEALKGLAHNENKVCSVLRRPGMALQLLTTAEPDESMLEVAIVSMKAALGDMPEGPLTEDGYILAVPPRAEEPKEESEKA
ncbi:MAG: DUF1385 domain-containing protein [Clostridia bacterium]|nr:DUF1385 domain-containing protein [Clostridia bacterium]